MKNQNLEDWVKRFRNNERKELLKEIRRITKKWIIPNLKNSLVNKLKELNL